MLLRCGVHSEWFIIHLCIFPNDFIPNTRRVKFKYINTLSLQTASNEALLSLGSSLKKAFLL